MPDAVHEPSRNWARPAVILVATDLSDLDRLMPHAIEQAAASGARLLLLHALPTIAAISADASGLPYYDTSSALQIADRSMQLWCTLSRARGIGCEALVREGDPSHEIAVAIRQFHADRVIVGTRSRSKLGKLLVGSVAEQVLRSVNLPVITVGPEAHLEESDSRDSVMLLATTLREASRPGAALACQIAAVQKSRLIALHVLPPVEVMERKHQPTGPDSDAMRELRRLASEMAADCGVLIEPVVAHGNPVIEILATASERHASLIMLGVTQRSAFENLTRDRAVSRVLAHARCPVLTLREQQPVFVEHHAETATANHV
jgi:nucleotide-binding universal stress UspA family protein